MKLAISILPLALGLAGGFKVSRGEPDGWWYLGAGAALLIADILIDFVWAHPAVSKSDQPDLNRRAAQFVGRVPVVEEAIEGGRGKVRVGDTLWPVEGPDLPASAHVAVTAFRGNLLVVARA